MPCMPAMKMKSPARAPRLQVPAALMAPGGLSVLTPLGESERAGTRLVASEIAAHRDNPRTHMRSQPSRFAVPRMWLFGGNIHLVEVLREHRRCEEGDGTHVSLPVFSRSWRIGVGRTNTLPGPA